MSTYILMKILESSARRYDWGIRLLSLGRLNAIYDDLISWVDKGQRVLDLGCGTGALTLRAARKGAFVKGLDVNPEMLEIARKRVETENLTDRVELVEMGVAELDAEPPESYDVVMGGLCFSELTENERAYSLKQIRRILKPNGLLLIADEIVPENGVKRILVQAIRIPLILLTYFLTQTTTHPLKNPASQIKNEGFLIEDSRKSVTGDFIRIVARKM